MTAPTARIASLHVRTMQQQSDISGTWLSEIHKSA
jgi:hypothetical protein